MFQNLEQLSGCHWLSFRLSDRL